MLDAEQKYSGGKTRISLPRERGRLLLPGTLVAAAAAAKAWQS